MATLTSVFDRAHLRKYPKGQILLYQGEKTDNVFQIKSGYVKVYDVTSHGSEKLMIILGPGDIFPLVWTFKGGDSLLYFYETSEDAEVAVVARKELLNSFSSSHEFTVHLLEYFVERTSDLMKRIECIEGTSAKHKVGQVLNYLAYSHGDKLNEGGYKIMCNVTHQMVADMAGITRETASLQIKKLEKANLVQNTNSDLIVYADLIKEKLSL